MLTAIDGLLSKKKVQELEAKNNFLLIKTNKLQIKLNKQKMENRIAMDKLNNSLLLNEKIEEYIGNPGDVLNKAWLFDGHLAAHPVSATNVIPTFVDKASKMDEFLNDMRSLFDGLGPKPTQEVVLEHIPNISIETKKIQSFIGWRRKASPTQTPTKPSQPGPSEPAKVIQEIEPVRELEAQPTSLEQGVGELGATREI